MKNKISKNMKNLVEYINESKVNYYIWQEGKDWYGTDETNKNARIQNARAILKFQGFDTEEEVREYIAKYFNTVDNVILLDKRP
jgi:hypothetical protein